LNRQGRSGDFKRAAAVHFAQQVTETRGKVSDADLREVRDAGFSDAQILEIVALSVQFLLTNFINNVAETDGDAFPDDDVQGSTVLVDAD
jgi:alkylhydroperoxidase family enzyme